MNDAAGVVTATSLAQRAAWRRREAPAVEQVRPGVWAIPVPVPNPIRFTYAYLVRGARESVLIDPGADTDTAWAALTNAFAAIGFDTANLTGIVVTHFHFDHWEMADRLAAATGAWIALSRTERDWIAGMTAADLSHETAYERFRHWGAPEAEATALAGSEDYAETLRYTVPTLLLEHDQRLPIAGTDLKVLLTPGHSPGHLCLVDTERNLLFAGDHVLPGITPHVALNPFGSEDPLGEYLESLNLLLPHHGAEVLPAHEYRFVGVAARVRELRRAVDDRLDELHGLVAENPTASVWDLAHALTWSRGWDGLNTLGRRMAMGETAAHLNHLARGYPLPTAQQARASLP
ncbi:MBL fold metallo-hydrolase [Occultella gossypii]|uniref:MBL fold metallo-hydrolase n=1 Tax=Occultella gossypii TaxID=2800820 RepID=A0ABS7S554_9MICO|nr:MBL fold metallo-hydrolase [Occultella gossypii]MBZ2195450.1 MBL fold metallo-hydrolase [Occultella gossypii]